LIDAHEAIEIRALSVIPEAIEIRYNGSEKPGKTRHF
jgi:hypothetical protein